MVGGQVRRGAMWYGVVRRGTMWATLITLVVIGAAARAASYRDHTSPRDARMVRWCAGEARLALSLPPHGSRRSHRPHRRHHGHCRRRRRSAADVKN